LKTPETEASGVSILITRSTTGCCVLQLPQRRTCSFRCRSFLWLRWLQEPSTFADCSWSSSTSGQLLRLGSVFCHQAQPVAETSDFRRLLSASDRPLADLPACAGVPPRARPATNFRLAPGVDPSTRQVERPSTFVKCRPQLLACAVCCFNLQRALAVAPLPYRRRTSDSHRMLPSGFTGFDSRSLRCRSLLPAGSLMCP
jgi:hypothetical protein